MRQRFHIEVIIRMIAQFARHHRFLAQHEFALMSLYFAEKLSVIYEYLSPTNGASSAINHLENPNKNLRATDNVRGKKMKIFKKLLF